jgi:hypothetical protein
MQRNHTADVAAGCMLSQDDVTATRPYFDNPKRFKARMASVPETWRSSGTFRLERGQQGPARLRQREFFQIQLSGFFEIGQSLFYAGDPG